MKNSLDQVPSVPKPSSKEFVTTWGRVGINSHGNLSHQARRYFDHPRSDPAGHFSADMLFPEAIQFHELAKFYGFKTKITIEVID